MTVAMDELITLCRSFLEINKRFVMSWVTFIVDVWSAVRDVICTLGEVVKYVLDFLVELGHCLYGVVCIVCQVTLILWHVLVWIFGFVESATLLLADLLRLVLLQVLNKAQALGVTTENAHDVLKAVRSRFNDGASAIIELAHSAIKSCSDNICLLSAFIFSAAWSYMALVMSYAHSFLNFCLFDIPHGVNSVFKTVAASNDLTVLVLTVGALLISYMLVGVLKKHGLAVPFSSQLYAPYRQINRTFLVYRPDEPLIFVSDEEDEEDERSSEVTDDDTLSTRTHSSHYDSVHSRMNSSDSETSSHDDDFTGSDVSSVSEYEVVEDSDSDFESGDENDQNAINIQLPDRSRAPAAHRASPAVSLHRLSMSEIQQRIEKERDKVACVVCQDQPKNVVVLPCKHMCMCVDCAHTIAKLPNAVRRVCPLCRSRIHTVMDVYV